jgi:transcriptional regulator with XRE-family HTH domain
VDQSERHQDGLIATRLEHLFRIVRPRERGPWTPAEVAAAINATAGEPVISATYLWQLRTGRRDNPTYKHLVALARFFGVSPAYFFDDADTARGTIPADVTIALQDDQVRDIVSRTAGLSERSLAAIKDLVDSARAVERLPAQQAGTRGPAAD